jgi:hypothetical protein
MVYFTDVYSTALLAAAILAAIAVTVGVYYFVNEKKFSQLRSWADIVVRSVEQKMKLLDGPKKLELAMLAMRTVRDAVHAKASDDDLRNIIEAAVFTMKNIAANLPGEADDELIKAITNGLPGSE